MKIRVSLQLYILLALMLLGVGLSISYTVLTARFFEEGLDIGLNHSMFRAVHETTLAPGEVKEVQGFVLATRWKDLPEDITTTFEKPQKYGQLQKKVDGLPILGQVNSVRFVGMYPSQNDQATYISINIVPENELRKAKAERPVSPMLLIIISGVAGTLLFVGVLLILFRSVALPVERLRDWARSLNENNLDNAAPDFRYSELNTLARIVQTSLSKVQQGLNREKEFLQYASHELRTPIAVCRSNAALMKKMLSRTSGNEKQTQVIERIERASITMSDLTETLLWLSREDALQVDARKFQMDEIITQLVDDLGYLLQGKIIELVLETEPFVCEASETVTRIILGNFIRNAFQHTQSGRITICQQGKNIVISNSLEDLEQAPQNLGFGLGLQLAKRLAEQCQWHYETNISAQRFVVTVVINASDT